jgi:MSHA pilin protein MshA
MGYYMRKSLSRNKQTGFTLIELVVVIVILGILAATALPRFVNMSSNARIASANGLIGALNSASSITHAQFLVTSPAASPVTVEGSTVAVWGGYPDASAGGIGNALLNSSAGTYTVVYGTAATSAQTAVYTFQTGCFVTYTAATATSTTAVATVTPTAILTNTSGTSC